MNLPDISEKLLLLKKNPHMLSGLKRGIERETLRIKPNGEISTSIHPICFGKSLTHPWITTDFAESLLELVTPTYQDIGYVLKFLRDLHRFVLKNLDHELIWPLSMPCLLRSDSHINLAKYGISNLAKFKMLYRTGLKHRYGSSMQIISGIHYNFSFSLNFWKILSDPNDKRNQLEKVSDGYLKIIRNYYRFGWIIPYLFGASPGILKSSLKNENIFSMKYGREGTYYLPYATSLRLSDIGYTGEFQNKIDIHLNGLLDYVQSIKKALNEPHPTFINIGLKDCFGNLLQLNTNILQIENELYSTIRPKRSTISGESYIDSILKKGIEYLEIRSLDINPFTAIGIHETQIYFLDLFLIWCALTESPLMNREELYRCKKNWKEIVLNGRKPYNRILIDNVSRSIKNVGNDLFEKLTKVADTLQDIFLSEKYKIVCNELRTMIDRPELTYSGRMMNLMVRDGLLKYGLKLAKTYRTELRSEEFEVISNKDFEKMREFSIRRQREIEQSDQLSFEKYLKKKMKRSLS
ncbi:glutamate--cysteine ligase [Candidatus Riesia pediculicola]|uniref:Glutamate--cysteine ligase n=1 Tax=Riesia pediculicola (strain USDA) TaxID=515618 RepID=D4G7M1_RIEPU|nr:glutamate--cysteine ligase [Candidatus Riesia pediculicola]ADD79767.1 glutamate--cysteine ligase [Candidatus Riesia pediculicola USDA]ARC53597.1 glutamate--cysteine ligase [Candidatus Riesia pediculicola]QOJ86250.1 glutamate--cysteine ligase [Candidatus Riesia pediculicola]